MAEPKKKTVLITGCSSGFGRDLVVVLLRQGCHVLATMRRANERRSLLSAAVQEAGTSLEILELDVTDATSRARIRTHIEAQHGGRLDVLINNAGYGLFGALEDMSEKQLREQMEANFFGLALLARDLLPALRASRGKLINLSSVYGYFGMPLTAAYCASKYAVEGLSESLRHELAPHGVQVSIVEPGGHRTQFTDSVLWSERAFDPASPYHRQSLNYRDMKDGAARSSGMLSLLGESRSVVRALARLVRKRRIPMRVRCGRDAALIYALKRILPGEWLIRLTTCFVGWIFRRTRPS